MSLGLDVEGPFRKSKFRKSTVKPHVLLKNDDSEARRILNLDTTHVGPIRNNSTSSTSTTRIPSVTFSDATTAAVSAGDTTETPKQERSLPDIDRKASSVLLKRQRKAEIQEPHVIKPETFDSSLRSFYDKSGAPLSVSQQTSNSPSRGFALRIGTPSIIRASSQEMEHSKQLRCFGKSQKNPMYNMNRLAPLIARPSTNSSQRSLVSSASEAQSEAEGSKASQPSSSQTTITKGPFKTKTKSPLPTKHPVSTEHPSPGVKAVADPARAKVNVRRPKAGAKNWFDNLESESSEGEQSILEVQLQGDFPIEVKAPLDGRHRYPPRSSSKNATAESGRTLKPQTSQRSLRPISTLR